MLFPTEYQSFIHRSRYALWNQEEERRETGTETVDRYFDFFQEHLLTHHDYNLTGTLRARLHGAVSRFDTMPSMRCMMTAGRALARDNIAGYNPVTGDTKVLTKEHGMIPIHFLSGQSATVLNKDGEWTPAEFSSHGTQSIREVHLRLNSNTKRMVRASGNHRWVLQNGQVLSTDELSPGDRIDFVSAPKPDIDDDYALGMVLYTATVPLLNLVAELRAIIYEFVVIKNLFYPGSRVIRYVILLRIWVIPWL